MIAAFLTVATLDVGAQRQPDLSFFVTSVAPGDGGNLGGLSGADAQCQKLAATVGAGQRTWRAYLSAVGAGKTPVHAKDRVGNGPWLNAKGVQIAANVAELHGPTNNISVTTALDERGRRVPVDRHDMLTGSTEKGTLATGRDTTCGNWTSNFGGRAIVGHHDKAGGPLSWNSNHLSEGCSAAALRATGGAGLFYCFAID